MVTVIIKRELLQVTQAFDKIVPTDIELELLNATLHLQQIYTYNI